MFNARDALEISRIPLNLRQEDDKSTWKLSRNEIYSVRSAYQLMEVIIDNNHLKVDGNWKKLWRTQNTLQDWVHVQLKQNRLHKGTSAMASYVWSKPAREMFKCNVDTAGYGEQNIYSVGSHVRDDNADLCKLM
ncbi:hypothetical protein A2U01_0002434 [Trifolium medium]|uniref:Uncharacterized protein n=1 Tax=Trifolium medium TaxID=97028 RepID=A0A392M3M6_9FABA|nr:hypothetical protein [Trifolium medium]